MFTNTSICNADTFWSGSRFLAAISELQSSCEIHENAVTLGIPLTLFLVLAISRGRIFRSGIKMRIRFSSCCSCPQFSLFPLSILAQTPASVGTGPRNPGPGRRTPAGRSERPILRRQRLDADLCRAGPADDRPRPGAFLRRPGSPQKHPRHHDAELRHDGPGHHHLGHRSATRWPSATATSSSAASSTSSCAALGLLPTPTTPPPFPSRPT